jgi:hypothetical protein
MDNITLEPHLQRMVDAGVSGTDILHGELKNLMLISEQEFAEISSQEEDSDYSDAILSMERTRAEGRLDALVEVYNLTYALSFAISDRMKLTN